MAAYFPRQAYTRFNLSPAVIRFRHTALAQATQGPLLETADALIEWIRASRLTGICLAAPPIGHWDTVLPELKNRLQQAGLGIHCARHWWDTHFYPHATHGFFRFKHAIPGALSRLHEDPSPAPVHP